MESTMQYLQTKLFGYWIEINRLLMSIGINNFLLIGEARGRKNEGKQYWWFIFAVYLNSQQKIFSKIVDNCDPSFFRRRGGREREILRGDVLDSKYSGQGYMNYFLKKIIFLHYDVDIISVQMRFEVLIPRLCLPGKFLVSNNVSFCLEPKVVSFVYNYMVFRLPIIITRLLQFVAGCGKFFEGTAEQMYQSLCVTLGSLPKPTRVYCGHEVWEFWCPFFGLISMLV